MFERAAPVRDPVTFDFEGRLITAERGEPLAIALLAAGESVIARSPKLHRPRAPACLRGDCDGCIARVDGIPNVMTCMRAATGGEHVHVQNVLGSRKTDLLRITDWFFPRGIDHHHLMVGMPGVHAAMQTFARQMAGIGKLPDPPPPRVVPATEEACDVLVVGAGLSGLAAASRLAAEGIAVILADENASIGGSAALEPDAAPHLSALDAAPLGNRRLGATVIGFYEGKALLVEGDRSTLVQPRAMLVATGAHDGVLCTSGNDLPGVMSARAVCSLARRGIVPKRGALVVGDSPWAQRTANALGKRAVGIVPERDVAEIGGRSRVRSVQLLSSSQAIECSVVALAIDASPSFQIAAQAGAKTRATPAGFSVVVDGSGRAAERVWAAGECTGVAFDPDALKDSGLRAAQGLVACAGELGIQIGRARPTGATARQVPSITDSKSPKPPTTKMKPKRPERTK